MEVYECVMGHFGLVYLERSLCLLESICMASLGMGKHTSAAGQANAHTFVFFPRRAVGKKHFSFSFWLILFFLQEEDST